MAQNDEARPIIEAEEKELTVGTFVEKFNKNPGEALVELGKHIETKSLEKVDVHETSRLLALVTVGSIGAVSSLSGSMPEQLIILGRAITATFGVGAETIGIWNSVKGDLVRSSDIGPKIGKELREIGEALSEKKIIRC